MRQSFFGTDILPSFISETDQLAYPSSSYMMRPDPRGEEKNTVSRGFCNWLLPNALMIGQYPGMTPESNGPSQKECSIHIENMVSDAKITLFCCLQSEVPCQLDDVAWASDVYLEPYYRREFPRPFTRYSTIAQALAERPIKFIHNPIEDLSVPTCNSSLLNLLSQLIQHFEEGGNAIYLHCWGGRGRAGLIGSCLVSLIFPELSSKQVLDLVQKAYSTRAGANSMPSGLRRSPQTEQQLSFVKEFVTLVQSEKKNMDV
jgi:alanine transaminase